MRSLVEAGKKYGCIIADPPWPESGGGKIKRGADRHYPLMRVGDIAALPVRAVAADKSHLYMWVTNNYLDAALTQVLPAWDFTYVTMITWLKEGRPGLGQYFRGTTEHVIFARRGRPSYRQRADGKRAQGLTGIVETEGAWWSEPRPGMVHSRKPSKIHEWAELVSHGPYLEMFARSSREGWDSWGNEAPSNGAGELTESRHAIQITGVAPRMRGHALHAHHRVRPRQSHALHRASDAHDHALHRTV